MGQPLQFTIFYGYSAELIAEWCCVSLRAARDLKAGKRKPSKQIAKLFLLHKAERVLNGKWRDWVVRGDAIVDPDGKATTHAQLQGYWLIMQFAAELAREAGPAAHLEFQRLLA